MTCGLDPPLENRLTAKLVVVNLVKLHLTKFNLQSSSFFLGGGGWGNKKGRRTPDRSIKYYSNLMEGASISHTYQVLKRVHVSHHMLFTIFFKKV